MRSIWGALLAAALLCCQSVECRLGKESLVARAFVNTTTSTFSSSKSTGLGLVPSKSLPTTIPQPDRTLPSDESSKPTERSRSQRPGRQSRTRTTTRGISQVTGSSDPTRNSISQQSRNATTKIDTTTSISDTSSCWLPTTTVDWEGRACLTYCDPLYTRTVFVDVNVTETFFSTVTYTGTTRAPLFSPKPTIYTPLAPCQNPEAFTSLISSGPTDTPHLAPPTTTILLTSKLTMISVTLQTPPSFSDPTNRPKDPVILTAPGVQSEVNTATRSTPPLPPTAVVPSSIVTHHQATSVPTNIKSVDSPPILPSKASHPPSRASATVTVGSVPVVIAPSAVIISSRTFAAISGDRSVVTAGGQTFTINPSEVIGPGVTFVRPSVTPQVPTSTVIDGIPIVIQSSIAVVGGSTVTFGPGAVETNVITAGQTISVGAGGIGFAGTTIFPGSSPASITGPDGLIIIPVGSSQVVIGGSTFTIGPSSPQTTLVISGHSISIGPGGLGAGSVTFAPSQIFPTPADNTGPIPTIEVVNGHPVTIGPVWNSNENEVQYKTITAGAFTFTEVLMSDSTYAIFGGQTFALGSMGASPASVHLPPDPAEKQLITVGGMTFAEIGSSLAVMDGKTYHFGEGALPTTAVIDGQTISFGPNGIGFASTTVSVMPEITGTYLATTDGVTFTEIGSTIAIIGGNTFRIGPGAEQVTEIVGGKTISIGPGGVGVLATKSRTSGSSSGSSGSLTIGTSATATQTKKGGGERSRSKSHSAFVWAGCMTVGVWVWM